MTLMIKKILILGKKEEQNTNVDEIRDISSNEYNYKRKKKKQVSEWNCYLIKVINYSRSFMI